MITMTSLDQARLQILIDLAAKSGGRVTPDEFLTAVEGKQKMILNILWLARRCGYVTVNQIRDGRKIAYWEVAVTGTCPQVTAALTVAKTKVEKTTKTSKSTSATKTVKPASKTKTAEQIKAANLAKMKKVSAKLAAKKKRTKKTIDVVEQELGSTGEIATSYNVDPAWDSVEGLDIQKLVA